MQEVLNCSLVVPVFNESKRWNAKYWESIAELPIHKIIFVNDGSSDDSLILINQVTSNKCEVIDLKSNVGKAEALRIGFRHALSNNVGISVVGFMDSDGAFQISDISRLLEITRDAYSTKSFDAVWSSRVTLLGTDIQRSLTRHYIGRIITTFLSSGSKIFPYDSQCGLKFFIMAENDLNVFHDKFKTRWFYDLELWLRLLNHYRAQEKRYFVQEVPLHSWRDVKGSKIKGFEIFRIVREIIAIRRRIKLDQL